MTATTPATVWPAEAGVLHPRWCRPGCDGAHRSAVLRAGGGEVYATADDRWRVKVHASGSQRGLRRQIHYLLHPAGNGH